MSTDKVEIERAPLTAGKAFEVVAKIVALLPLIFSLFALIQAARDASSVGGSKITVAEWGDILKTSAEKLLAAAKAIFGTGV